MVESLGITCHHATISPHPYGKNSSDAMILIRGTCLPPNMVLDKGTTNLSKQSFIQPHDDRRIDKEPLVFKKNRRSPSGLSVPERDSVQKDRGPVKPNTKTTIDKAIHVPAATGNQFNADLAIKSSVSASISPGMDRHQFPTWDRPWTSLPISETPKHSNPDPEQHAMYVGATNGEISAYII